MEQSWQQSLKAFTHPRVVTMLFYGISAGLPLLLIFSSLGLWLREAGVERAAVTYFSWAALGYSFKFIWAPLVDTLPIPYLTRRMGRRRAWLLLSQGLVMTAILSMSVIDPATDQLTFMAVAAVFLGFSSATQDIVIDAYRIESAPESMQALLSSTYIAGYRIGMLIAGAGALFLASILGSTAEHYQHQAWQQTYMLMAMMMLIGIITTLAIKEPDAKTTASHQHTAHDYLSLVLVFAIMVAVFILAYNNLPFTQIATQISDPALSFLLEAARLISALIIALLGSWLVLETGLVNKQLVLTAYILPLKDFFQRYGGYLAVLLLALIGLYRISDIVLGVISNVFFQDMGFSKIEIASVVKTFGLFMTIAGGFLGGILAIRFGVMRILFLGALLTVVTNLLFMVLADTGYNLPLLYVVISADNLSAGLASAAFIAFLSALTNVSFTAVQYAIFSSLMTLLPKVLGGYSGSMVEVMGYSNFFLFASLIGLPVLLLILWIQRYIDIDDQPLSKS